MTKSHRNFIDFLTDHEKPVLDRQTGCSGCARWKTTPGATGIAPPECQKHPVFHPEQSLMNISHSRPTVQSLVLGTGHTRIPSCPYTWVLYLPIRKHPRLFP